MFRKLITIIAVTILLAALFASCNLWGNVDDLRPNQDHSFTVTFNSGDGNPAPSSQTVDKGGVAAEPPAMTKTGYTFGGWYKDAAFTKAWDFTVDTVGANITLYAKWNAHTYTVVYDANGGGGAMESSGYVYGTPKALDANTFTYADHVFAGWARTETGIVEFDDEQDVDNLSAVDGDTVTLYAQWGLYLYYIAYDANGGSGAMNTSTFAYGLSKKLSAAIFTRTGYTFAGWARTDTGAVEFDDEQVVSDLGAAPGDTVTLYAEWNAATYTITYRDVGGGTFSGVFGPGNPATHTYGTPTALVSPAKPGSQYNFGGWFINSDGTGTALTSLSATDYTANITLYAKWNPVIYAITYYDVGGGTFSGVHESVYPEAYIYGTAVDLDSPERTGFTFIGWFINSDGTGTALSSLSATGYLADITLYAKWQTNQVAGLTLADKLTWLQSNAQSGVNYIVEVDADESISPQRLDHGSGSAIGITLRGEGVVRTISLSGNGRLFEICSGITLILDNNITLKGHDNNSDPLVMVEYGGALEMNTGCTITGNAIVSSSEGGGVYVNDGATFTMRGGKISGNTTYNGGGGGVMVVGDGILTMSGGEISGNTAAGNGGGVCLTGYSYNGSHFGSLTMSGGKITGNTAANYGGGVGMRGDREYLVGGNLTMNGGEISGNTANYGGGVGADCLGNFTMSGGEIKGNTAANYGGGVGMAYYYVFLSKEAGPSGGTIYGYDENDPVNSNVVGERDQNGNITSVQNDCGHAVYIITSDPAKRKESTAGPTVSLWYSYTSWNGAWDY